MRYKRIIFIILLIVISTGLIYSYANKDVYKYVTKDFMSKWYYDTSSVEKWIDEETGAEIIDVFVRREMTDDTNPCFRDKILWHIDYENARYKTTDAEATAKDGTVLET